MEATFYFLEFPRCLCEVAFDVGRMLMNAFILKRKTNWPSLDKIVQRFFLVFFFLFLTSAFR